MLHKLNFTHQDCTWFAYLVILMGLIFSPFLLSVGMFGLALFGLGVFSMEAGKLRVHWNIAGWRRWWTAWHRFVPLLALSGLFLVVVLGVWNTEDWPYWWERMRIKVPFLGLPLAFVALPKLSSRHFHSLLYILLVVLVISSIGVGINYLMHFEEVQQALKEGRAIPTPRHHIRNSLMLSLGVIGGLHLWQSGYVWRKPIERPLILLMVCFLFVFQHVLSVRTGLLATYVGLGAYAVGVAIQTRRYWLILAALGVITLLPTLAYFSVPSFQAKIDYVRYDMFKHRQGDGSEYGDSGRIASLTCGWHLWQNHFWWGVGPGNLDKEVQAYFKEHYPKYPRRAQVPHNQFLFTAVGTGLFGLLLLLVILTYSSFARGHYRVPLFLAFMGMVFTVFMLDHTIEASLGVGWMLFTWCFFWRQLEPAASARSSRYPTSS